MHKLTSGLERSLTAAVKSMTEMTSDVGVILRHRSTGLGGARNAAKDRRLNRQALDELQTVKRKLELLEAYLQSDSMTTKR